LGKKWWKLILRYRSLGVSDSLSMEWAPLAPRKLYEEDWDLKIDMDKETQKIDYSGYLVNLKRVAYFENFDY